jgi:hypothetical protein
VYRTLNTKYKTFLHEVGKSWISGIQNRSEFSRLSGVFRIHKLEKAVGGGEGRRKYPARQCKVCVAHKKRSEIKIHFKFCVVPLHKGSCFEKYHSVTS